ncbi:FAD binding domain-containing protein [Radiomyces spectabilis]|uniref:FAD binding domain-containing protein n=1 Tax=Radiomyces spectabilis TaxID=64574 RepID=UPI00221FC0DB|nr:FAD binding domain-containing protein [Radiomyces spectabilis]KAI8379237.1 FAD binding domain-containing protein [Radiomyces spectabilis]
MPYSVIDSEVLILGAGLSGLYTALLLRSMGISVRIIDKAQSSGSNRMAFLWSPRSLQLLQAFDLVDAVMSRSVRHWRFETYTHKGHGSSAATVDCQSHRVWENEATEFSWSLSCECDHICQQIKAALEKRGIAVEYGQEIVDLETVSTASTDVPMPSSLSSTNHFASYKFQHPYIQHVVASIRNTESGQIHQWKSRIVIGADGINSFVRQKLGLAQQYGKSPLVFYTLEATVSTNFPGKRTLSTVTKGQDTLFIIGHKDKLYIIFEHKPSWSKLHIDDEVPLLIAQRHIRNVLEPRHIEFDVVHAYYRWSADDRTCEEYNVDHRYFLIGGATQHICPPGLFANNLALEQAHNLCWKLALYLRDRASPLLLDTFETEARAKLDALLCSARQFIQLLGHDPSVFRGLNATYAREMGYYLTRHRHCFVGNTPYSSNLINLNSDNTMSPAASLTHLVSDMEHHTSTKAAANQHQLPFELGSVGSLAQNAKLKPYTVYQLLLAQPSSGKIHDTTRVRASLDYSVTTETMSQQRTQYTVKSRFGQRPRSRSASQLPSIGWYLTPILHNMTKKALQYYPGANKSNTMATTVSHEDGGTASSPHQSADRWKGIRANHHQLLDRITGKGHSPLKFVILVFCGSLLDPTALSMLHTLKRHLDSPQSFVHRYEKSPQYFHSNEPSIYSHPLARRSTQSVLAARRISGSSVLSDTSLIRSSSLNTYRSISTGPSLNPMTSSAAQGRHNTPRLSTSQRTSSRRHSSESSSGHDMASSDVFEAELPLDESLFSFLYITSSTKQDVAKFLTQTPPAIVHAAFPLGLDKVYLDHDQQSYTAYQIKRPTVLVVRPDGYIGARISPQTEDDFHRLDVYFDHFLRPPVDLYSSAAVVAADYDCE